MYAPLTLIRYWGPFRPIAVSQCIVVIKAIVTDTSTSSLVSLYYKIENTNFTHSGHFLSKYEQILPISDQRLE